MPYLQRFTSVAATLCLAAVVAPDHSDDWCAAMQSTLQPEMSEQEAADRTAIEQHPVCVGSRIWSAGRMADTVFYEYRRHGDRLTVGYFVHWTTERPWGSNGLTYGFLPALLVDAFYSHTFFLLPGARDVLYGPGDIEGASVTYRQEAGGELVPIGGVADDDWHNSVTLSAEDLDAGGRTALVTEVWSHQLGGKGGARLLRDVLDEQAQTTSDGSASLTGTALELASQMTSAPQAARAPRAAGAPQAGKGAVRCFSGASLRPLPETVAEKFRLGSSEAPRRAKPAWRLSAVHEDSWGKLAVREAE